MLRQASHWCISSKNIIEFQDMHTFLSTWFFHNVGTRSISMPIWWPLGKLQFLQNAGHQ
jgi:hypothetical protein